MFKIPLAFILSLSLLSPFKWLASTFRTPATPAEVASASTVRITGIKTVNSWIGPVEVEYGCSGFVIAPKKILTANHCLDKATNVKYDGIPGNKIILHNEYFDLAVVDVNTGKKPLELREDEVRTDEKLTAIGYGFGWDRLLVLAEAVRIPNYPVEDGAASGIIMQGGLIGGMSGGPIIDGDGKVVSICQRGSEFIGYGVSALTIKAFLRDAEGHNVGSPLLPRYIPFNEV